MSLDLVYPLDLLGSPNLEPPDRGLVAIYGLYDPRDGTLRYIGRSVNPRTRLRDHVTLSDKNGYYRARWLNKLRRLRLQPEMRILAWVSVDHWCEAERHYIAHARAQGCRLTNGSNGGDGINGTTLSDEVRARMKATWQVLGQDPERRARLSTFARARGQDPEYRAKMSAAIRAAHQNPEYSLKQSVAAKTRVLSAEQQAEIGAKISAAKKGRPQSPEAIARAAAARCGSKRGPETRAKMSAAAKARWQDPEQRAKLLAAIRAGQRKDFSNDSEC